MAFPIKLTMLFLAAPAFVLGSQAILTNEKAGIGPVGPTASATAAPGNSFGPATESRCLIAPDLVAQGGIARSSPLLSRIEGFARLAGVTGGQGKRVIEVTSTDDFPGRGQSSGTLRAALARAEAEGGGWIVFAPSLGASPRIELTKSLIVPSNVTIDGGCSGVTISSSPPFSVLKVMGPTRNVMIARLNLTQRDAAGVREGGDCVTVARGADAVWVGFNAMSACSDGMVDVTQGVDDGGPTRATVAFNHFFDHDKDMLIGSNECIEGHPGVCDAPASQPFRFDRGVQVTIQGNLFDGTSQRHPRISGRSYVDLSGNVVSAKGQLRDNGKTGGVYGSYVGGGGRLLARDNLFLGLDSDRQLRAIVSADMEEPREREDGKRKGALEGKSMISVERNVLVNAGFVYNSAGQPETPPYTLSAGPRLTSGGWKGFAACIATRVGPGGLAAVSANRACP